MDKLLIIDNDTDYVKKFTGTMKSRADAITIYNANSTIEGMALLTQTSVNTAIVGCPSIRKDDLLFIRTVLSMKPQLKIIVIAEKLNDRAELAALNNGAVFCECKSKNLEIVVTYILRIMSEISLDSIDANNYRLTSKRSQLVIDQMTHKLYMRGKELPVSQKEFEIIKLLLENKDKALTREEIAARLWDSNLEKILPRAVDGHIKRIRSKFNILAIATIRGYGYKWVENEGVSKT